MMKQVQPILNTRQYNIRKYSELGCYFIICCVISRYTFWS